MHRLELEHKKSELDFLKSQIGPHFLFNTLNTFYAELMDKQPETAKDIHKLSELLRYVIYEAQEDAVSIDKELKFVEEYIYFFRKRFEDQLFLDYSVEGEVQDQKIPSLILIHFVENLFKHGVVTDSNRAARIKISLKQNHFVLQTENRTAPSEKHMD
jgi:LytS/YehU family sensor histidine kinase